MDPISPITMRHHLAAVASLDRALPLPRHGARDVTAAGEATPPLAGMPLKAAPVGRSERLLAKWLRG